MTDRYESEVVNECARWGFTYRHQSLTIIEQQVDSLLSEDNPSELLHAIVRIAIQRACREQYHSTPSMCAWHQLAHDVEAVACDMQDLPFGDEGDDEAVAA